MNKQRQILVTVTYNDLGCIIDIKAEPYEEPNLQPTCNQLATSYISRQAAIDAIITLWADKPFGNPALSEIKECIDNLPPAEPDKDENCNTCRYESHDPTDFPCSECKVRCENYYERRTND